MGTEQFDDLARMLATGTPRRQALKLFGATLAGGMLAWLGGGPTAAAAPCRAAGRTCKTTDQCCGDLTCTPPSDGRGPSRCTRGGAGGA